MRLRNGSPSMTRIRDLRAKRYKIVEEAQRIAAKDLNSDEARRFDLMMKEAYNLKYEIERLEHSKRAEASALERMRARAMGENLPLEQVANKTSFEEEVFSVWARYGENALSPEQRAVFVKSFR